LLHFLTMHAIAYFASCAAILAATIAARAGLARFIPTDDPSTHTNTNTDRSN